MIKGCGKVLKDGDPIAYMLVVSGWGFQQPGALCPDCAADVDEATVESLRYVAAGTYPCGSPPKERYAKLAR